MKSKFIKLHTEFDIILINTDNIIRILPTKDAYHRSSLTTSNGKFQFLETPEKILKLIEGNQKEIQNLNKRDKREYKFQGYLIEGVDNETDIMVKLALDKKIFFNYDHTIYRIPK